MHTTTPPQITRHIRQLVQRVVPGGVATYMVVEPEPDALEKECFPNVEAKIARDGGRMLCGWQLWEWPHVMVEAEFHAIWLSPDGQMVDVTPKLHHETKVLFVSDPRRRYTGATVDNVRLPVRDDQLIRHFIGVSEAITHVLSRGVPTADGHVSVPENEIEPLQQAHQFLDTHCRRGCAITSRASAAAETSTSGAMADNWNAPFPCSPLDAFSGIV